MSADIVKAALVLAELMRANDVLFRLFGSCAIYIKCVDTQDIFHDNHRVVKDMDAVIGRRSLKRFRQLGAENGWREEVGVTALTDGQRLRLISDEWGTLDVAVDALRFNQTLLLRDRLSLDWPTISVTDLLLTKIQISAPTSNDVADMAALLAQFEVAPRNESALCVQRICEVSDSSWRWYRAVTVACGTLAGSALQSVNISPRRRHTIAERAHQIQAAVDETPKSLAWKARSAIGEWMRWSTPVETF